MKQITLTDQQKDLIKAYSCHYSISYMTGNEIEQVQTLLENNSEARALFNKHERLNEGAWALSLETA
jgi:hypothetical protein